MCRRARQSREWRDSSSVVECSRGIADPIFRAHLYGAWKGRTARNVEDVPCSSRVEFTIAIDDRRRGRCLRRAGARLHRPLPRRRPSPADNRRVHQSRCRTSTVRFILLLWQSCASLSISAWRARLDEFLRREGEMSLVKWMVIAYDVPGGQKWVMRVTSTSANFSLTPFLLISSIVGDRCLAFAHGTERGVVEECAAEQAYNRLMSDVRASLY